MTIYCFISHIPDLQFDECLCSLAPWPVPSVTGGWKQLEKQHEHQPSLRAKGLVGSVSAHSWLKYPMVEGRETLRKVLHRLAVLRAYIDWTSKHGERIWHFSFSNLSLHVNAFKIRANIWGGNFTHIMKTLGL